MTPRPSGMGIKAQRRQSPPLPSCGAEQLCSRNSFILPLTSPWLCQGQSPAATRGASTQARQEETGFLPCQSSRGTAVAQLALSCCPVAVASGCPQRGTAGLSPIPSIPATNPARSLLAKPRGPALCWLKDRRDFPPSTPPGFHKTSKHSLGQVPAPLSPHPAVCPVSPCPRVPRGFAPRRGAGSRQDGAGRQLPEPPARLQLFPAVSSCSLVSLSLPGALQHNAAPRQPRMNPGSAALGFCNHVLRAVCTFSLPQFVPPAPPGLSESLLPP